MEPALLSRQAPSPSRLSSKPSIRVSHVRISILKDNANVLRIFNIEGMLTYHLTSFNYDFP